MTAMQDKLRFIVTDAAEAVILHEALMSYRNQEAIMPADVLRAEAADRLLARLGSSIDSLGEFRKRESEVPILAADTLPDHTFAPGKRGVCIFPVPKGGVHVPCGKMRIIHSA